MDTLSLTGLQFTASHGYYDEERLRGNRFEVDLSFNMDLKKAGASDDLKQTVNYETAEEIVREIMEGPPVKLIETLACKIGERLFSALRYVQKLEVRVRKLSPPLNTEASHSEVVMRWQR